MKRKRTRIRAPNLNQLVNHPVKSVSSGTTTVHFDDIHQAICEQIRKADMVAGCVAWVTNPIILQELANKTKVTLVVNQESWLKKYKLPGQGIVTFPSKTKGVKEINQSRMHNKFLIFYKAGKPYMVGTGSFNLTTNSSNSLETFLFISDSKIITAMEGYLKSILKTCHQTAPKRRKTG